MGDLDNTLVFYIWGDNGASMEGTVTGSFNELTFLNGLVLDPEQQLALIEQYGGIEGLGGVHSAPHFAGAWAHACNTPFKYGKQTASHLGGTRDPMVVAWPASIAPDSEVRTQFTHVIDVGPTILQAAGIPEPDFVDGIAQEPMDGTSFLYSFNDKDAPEQHTQQFFEMFGSRGMYKDGWWAASRPEPSPVGRVTGDTRPVRARCGLGPRPRRRLGALRPHDRLLAGPRHRRRPPRQGAGVAGAVVERGGAQPGAAAHGRLVGDLRHPAADADPDAIPVRLGRPEHPARHDPADLRPVLRHRGRGRDPRVGRARRARRATPTSSAASPCGSTATASSSTPTRGSASSSTSRCPTHRSRRARSPSRCCSRPTS